MFKSNFSSHCNFCIDTEELLDLQNSQILIFYMLMHVVSLCPVML